MRLVFVLLCAVWLDASVDAWEIFPKYEPGHQDLDVNTALIDSKEDPSVDDHYSFMWEVNSEDEDSDTSRKSRVEPSDNIHNTETKDYLLSLSNENGSGNQQALDNGIDDYIINDNTTMKDDDHNTGNTTDMKSVDCQNVSSFSLLLQPKTVTAEQNSDVQLTCQLIPHDEKTAQMPPFLLSWVYENVDCLADKEMNESCEQILHTTAFNASDEVFEVVYNLYQLSSNKTGKYTCRAEITECVNEEDYIKPHQSVKLRVYTKPDYASHLAAISVVVILLLALLLALFFFIQRAEKGRKQRYQELVSSTKIQFYPTKILELPGNAVYHPTTTSIDHRSVNSFDSRYSLTSQDES